MSGVWSIALHWGRKNFSGGAGGSGGRYFLNCEMMGVLDRWDGLKGVYSISVSLFFIQPFPPGLAFSLSLDPGLGQTLVL